MIETLGQHSLDGRIFDVAIAGAGPAGIALALQLARKRPDWQVLLLEGGAEKPDPASAELHKGENGGLDYPIDASRLRFLGGASNHWGGWCRPLDAVDFEPQPALNRPGWPIRHDELAAYWPQADDWCELQHPGYEEDAIVEGRRARLLDLRQSRWFKHRVYRFSPPTRFGQRYREELAGRDNLRCVLDANLVALHFEGDRVQAASVRGLSGAAARVRARHFVLAMGGIDNARFLLNVQQQPELAGRPWPAAIGHYFADHYGLSAGWVLTRSALAYERESVDGVAGMPAIMYRDEVLREGAPNLLLRLVPDSEEHWFDREHALMPQGGNWTYRLAVTVDPQPVGDSRVQLSQRRDALGLRALRLDWHVSEQDFDSVKLACRRLARDLARIPDGGRLRMADLDRAKPPAALGPSYHHMGTTRMAEQSEHGVVDRHCRVFGTDNLHVAGSSVFASYGSANPTLTLVALALRLADRLALDEARAGA